MQKKQDQLEEENKSIKAGSSNLTAKNLAMIDAVGPAKLSRAGLDPIIEEGGTQDSNRIYMDENDPKKKKYDELKKKALLVTQRRNKKNNAMSSSSMSQKDGISDTSSVISDSKSNYTLTSHRTSSSQATMPFITYTKVQSKPKRASTPDNLPVTIDGLFKQFDDYVPEEKCVIRSYSPVPRSRPLNDDDDDEKYDTRMIELANDFDDCLDFMKDLCYFIKSGEDVQLMDNIKEITETAIDDHL